MRALPAFAITASLIIPATLSAQPGDTAGIVAAARKVIAARYVLPDTAAKLDAALAAGAKAGHYQGLTGEALAARINADMAAVTPDRHLAVKYDPKTAAILASAPSSDDEDAPPPPAMARMMARYNGGVRALEALPGNIRYLAYDGFAWGTPEAEAALRTAMTFLRGGDAYIIDIARNGGGDPRAVAALASYFVPEGTPLMRFELRGKSTDETRAPKAPFSLAGKPLFVVTGKGTASAAEEFSTHVKAYDFGTLVGESTAGAGFRNDFVPLTGGFLISVSVGRAVSLKTGKDWERVGVAPAIVTDADAALPRAKTEAMAAILATALADERDGDTRLLAYYRALQSPPALARPPADYAGRYGERVVDVREGVVTMRRGDRAPMVLVPVGPDRFVTRPDPTTGVLFVVDGGRVTAVEIDQGGVVAFREARAQ